MILFFNKDVKYNEKYFSGILWRRGYGRWNARRWSSTIRWIRWWPRRWTIILLPVWLTDLYPRLSRTVIGHNSFISTNYSSNILICLKNNTMITYCYFVIYVQEYFVNNDCYVCMNLVKILLIFLHYHRQSMYDYEHLNICTLYLVLYTLQSDMMFLCTVRNESNTMESIHPFK